MAENFERHRSTRWVKSKSQTYDAWGDQYDDYGYDSANNDLPEINEELVELKGTNETAHPESATDSQTAPAPQPSAPLVLSIDQLRRTSHADSLDDETDHESGPEVTDDTHASRVDVSTAHLESKDYTEPKLAAPRLDNFQYNYNHSENTEYPETSDFSNSKGTGVLEGLRIGKNAGKSDKAPPNNMAPIATHGLKDDDDFFPPTPTFSMKQYVQPQTPETPQSDRSFVSDTDLIQREPDSLNLAYGEPPLNEIREELPMVNEATNVAKQPPPEDLVLSIDRMNLVSSDDDSSLDEGVYNRHVDDNFGYDANEDGTNAYDEIINAEHSKAHIYDSSADEAGGDDDDWGYNSQHSSNDEGDEVLHLNTADKVTSQDSESRQPVKTDALDSLINDLLKLERLNTGFLEQLPKKEIAPVGRTSRIAEISAEQIVELYEGEHETDNSAPEASPPKSGNYDSNADLSPSELLPADFEEQHQKFVSNVQSRSASVRKVPPPVPKSAENEQTPAYKDSDVKLLASSRFETASRLEPVVSTGSISTGNASFDVASVTLPPMAPPPIADPDSLGRKMSTASNQTFNFGSWKPNTNKFRDQFVSDNDAESQMNVSIFNGDESTYNKFTGMRPQSGYAESFPNSSMLSIPETIDAPLQSIEESGLDDDALGDDSTREAFAANSQLDLNTVPSLNTDAPSVLKEHAHEKTTFTEERTPSSSLDNLTGDQKSNDTRVPSDSSSSRKASELTTKSVSTIKPPMTKYPVFNWKQIMNVSQPIDRITLLRKAQIDEMNYDTGLNYWLTETLKSSEASPHIQIGKIATQAYQNAQHIELRRHTSIRSKVSLVKDKMETGNFGLQASSFGRKFLNRGKKLMKSGSD